MGGDLLDAIVRDIDHGDPVASRGIDVDVVDTDPVTADHAPPGATVDDVRIDPAVLDEHTVCVAGNFDDLRARDPARVLEGHAVPSRRGDLHRDVPETGIEDDEATAGHERSSVR